LAGVTKYRQGSDQGFKKKSNRKEFNRKEREGRKGAR
jgi:hypothetical protein